MKGRFVVAQMQGNMDWKENVRKAEWVIAQSKERFQPDLILFPETFMSYVTDSVKQGERVALAQSLDGIFVQRMKEMAAQYHVWSVFGMRESAADKNYNTIVILDAEGKTRGVYRKTHLYDAFTGRESDEFLPGNQLFEPIDTPFGKLGLFVCYEARFPEIARAEALKGAQILLMPTAWVKGKRKKEQLRILACARALENTVYLLASNLCGGNCTGGSMIIDPLGEIITEAQEEEQLLFAEIDTEEIQNIRQTLPSLRNRRPEVYG